MVTSVIDSPTAGTFISLIPPDFTGSIAMDLDSDGLAVAGAPAASAISQMIVPIETVSPWAFVIFNIPACGAVSSKVALSDSSSAMISSIFTTSPSFFNQLAMVTSVIDSPTVGTFTC